MNPRTLLPFAAILTFAAPAFADEPKPAEEPKAEAKPEAKPEEAKPEAKPSPAEKKLGYSVPWLMRPAPAVTVLRIDAGYVAQDGGTIQTSVLTGAYKLTPELGLMARVAFVHTSPEVGDGASAFSNPLVAGVFAPEIAPHVRLNLFLGITAPLGSGGGNSPDLAKYGAVGAGIYARQAMDNALFAVNFLTPIVGAGVAYVDKGFTAQADVTVLQLLRARGSDVEKDEKRTNSTFGLHLGYRVLPILTLSVEFHHQRWLSTPLAVEKDDAKRAQSTLGAGARLNLPVDDHVLRPGFAFFMGLDDPMAAVKAKVFMIDVPFIF